MNNKDRLLCFFKAENSRKWDDYITYLHPDIEWNLYNGEKSTIINGLESYVNRIKSAYEGNDDSFSCEALYTGKSGKRIVTILINNHNQRSADIFEFKNGLIRREWEILI